MSAMILPVKASLPRDLARFHVLGPEAIGDLDIVIEDVADHTFKGGDGTSGIFAQVQDKGLVLFGDAEEVVDGTFIQIEFRRPALS
jgi:hypothetical protein